MNDFPKQNTGVREGRRLEDFLAGTLPYEIRNESGDWRPYLVKEEKQFSQNVDTMACVSFSANNSLEIQHKHQTGRELNFSDRFLAKMSGTTPQGNWLYIVADTIRHVGLVLDNEWPEPPGNTWGWDEYYSAIPQEVINKARKYDVSYEWVFVDEDNLSTLQKKEKLLHHLKHAPIQITIPEPYPNHAVVLIHIQDDTAYYFDTYPNYVKTMSISKISSALKLIGTFKENKDMFPAIRKEGTTTIYAQCGNTLFPFSSSEAYTHAGGEFGKEKVLSEPEFYKFDVRDESPIGKK